jgi:hypothetical protein
VVGLINKLSGEYKFDVNPQIIRAHVTPQLVDGVPWGFFDGANQGRPPQCDARNMLFISNSHSFMIINVLGCGTKNKPELSTLLALLFHVDMLKLRSFRCLVIRGSWYIGLTRPLYSRWDVFVH